MMQPGLKMVAFLHKYTEVMTLQIASIQSQLETSVSNAMHSVNELSASTEKRKAEAEAALEATYLSPDAGTALMVESIQKSTDDVFERAQAPGNQLMAADKDLADDVRRMGGMFSKHMESISTIDDSVKDLVMTMVGSLSNTDVIKQRLDHIVEILKALNLGLGNVIVDLDSRLTGEVIEHFKENLLDFAYKSYSIEEERIAFKQIFGAPPLLRRAYAKKTS